VIEPLTLDAFRPLVGEPFHVSTAPGGTLQIPETELTLMAVQDQGERFGAHALRYLKRRPFSVIFIGPRIGVLPQAYCRVEHPALGVIDHLLVPLISLDPQVQEYQMVFA
jgi:hypothetical protein